MAYNFKCYNRLKYLYAYRGIRFNFKSTLEPRIERPPKRLKSQDVITSTELQQLFEKKTSLTGPDIKNMEKSMIGKHYFNYLSHRWLQIESSTVSSFILKCCGRYDAIDVGFKYFKHLVDSGEKISLNERKLLFNLVQKDTKFCNENAEFLYEQYCQQKSLLDVMDYSTLKSCVMLLCSLDNHWKEALDFIKKNENDFIENIDGLHTLAASAAFKHNEPEFGWEILASCTDEFVIPSLVAYIDNLKESVVNGNFSVEKLNRLFDYMHHKQIYLHKSDIDFFKNLKHLVELLNDCYEKDYIWKISQSVANRESGHCPSCSKHLNETKLDSKSFNELRSSFFNDVLIGKDINIKSSHAEAKRFYKFLCSSPHFDVVLDGLNIAYKGNSNVFERITYLNHFITYFQSKNQHVLLLGRQHMAKWPKFKDIQKHCSVFLFDNGTDDDAYLIYAAMFKGINTCICTGDFLRGKTNYFVDQKLTEVFELWQKTHQYGLLVRGFNKTVIPPIKHAIFTHQILPKEAVDSGEINWHVACAPDEFSITGYNFEATLHWICLERLSHQNAKLASMEKDTASSKSVGEPFFTEEETEMPGINNIPSDLMHQHKVKIFRSNINSGLNDTLVDQNSSSELPSTEFDSNERSNNVEKPFDISDETDIGNLELSKNSLTSDENHLQFSDITAEKSKQPENLPGISTETNSDNVDFWRSASNSDINDLLTPNVNQGKSNGLEKSSGISAETDIDDSDFWKGRSNSDMGDLLFPTIERGLNNSKATLSKIVTDKRKSSYSNEIHHFSPDVNEKKVSNNIFRKIRDQELRSKIFETVSVSNRLEKDSHLSNEVLYKESGGSNPKGEPFKYSFRESDSVKNENTEDDFVFRSKDRIKKTHFNEPKFKRNKSQPITLDVDNPFNRQVQLEFPKKIETIKDQANSSKLAASNFQHSLETGTRTLSKKEMFENAREAVSDPGKNLQRDDFEAPKNIDKPNAKPKTFISSFKKSYEIGNIKKEHSFVDEERKIALKVIPDKKNPDSKVNVEISERSTEPNFSETKNDKIHEKVTPKGPNENLLKPEEKVIELSKVANKDSSKPKPFVSSFQRSDKHGGNKPVVGLTVNDVSRSNTQDQLKIQEISETTENKAGSLEILAEHSQYFLNAETKMLNKEETIETPQATMSELAKNLQEENDNAASRKTNEPNLQPESFSSPFKKSSQVENIKNDCSHSNSNPEKLANGTMGETSTSTSKNLYLQSVRHLSSFKKSYIIKNVSYNQGSPTDGSVDVPTPRAMIWTPDAWTSDAELNPDPLETSENVINAEESEDFEYERMAKYTMEDDYFSKNLERILEQGKERAKRINAALENPPDLVSNVSFWDLQHLNTAESGLYRTADEILLKNSEKITEKNSNADENLNEKDDNSSIVQQIQIEDKVENGSKLNSAISGDSFKENPVNLELYKMADELLLKSSERKKRNVLKKSVQATEMETVLGTESSSDNKKLDSDKTVLHEISQNAIFKSSGKVQKAPLVNSNSVVETDAKLIPKTEVAVRTKFEPNFTKLIMDTDKNVKSESRKKTNESKEKASPLNEDLLNTILQKLVSVKLKQNAKATSENLKMDTGLKSNIEANQSFVKVETAKESYEILDKVIAKMYLNIYQKKKKLSSFRSSFKKASVGKGAEMDSNKQVATSNDNSSYSEILTVLQKSSDKFEKSQASTLIEDPLYQIISDSLFKQIEKLVEKDLKERKLDDCNQSKNFVDGPFEIEEENLKKMEEAIGIYLSECFEQSPKKKILEDHQLKERVVNLVDSSGNNELNNDDEIDKQLILRNISDNRDKSKYESNDQVLLHREHNVLEKEKTANKNIAQNLTENDLQIELTKSNEMYSALQHSLTKSSERKRRDIISDDSAVEENLNPKSAILNFNDDLSPELSKKDSAESSENILKEGLTNDEEVYEQLISTGGKIKNSDKHVNLNVLNNEKFKSNDQDLFDSKCKVLESAQAKNYAEKLTEYDLGAELLKSNEMYSPLNNSLAKFLERKNQEDLKSDYWESFYPKFDALENEETLNEKIADETTESDFKTELLKPNRVYSTLQFSLAKSSKRKEEEEEMISKNSKAENLTINPNLAVINLNDGLPLKISETSKKIVDEKSSTDKKLYEQLILSGKKLKKVEQSVDSNSITTSNKVRNESSTERFKKKGDRLIENSEKFFDAADEIVSKFSKSNRKSEAYQKRKVPIYFNLNSISERENNVDVELYTKENFESKDTIPDTCLSKGAETDHGLSIASEFMESISHETDLATETEEKEYSTELESEENFASFECSLEKTLPKTSDFLSEIPRAEQGDFLKLNWDLPHEKVDQILSNFSTLKNEENTENQSNIFQVPLQSLKKQLSNTASEKPLNKTEEKDFIFFSTEENLKFALNNEINFLKDLDETSPASETYKTEPEENSVNQSYESNDSQSVEIFNGIFLPKVTIENMIEFRESQCADENENQKKKNFNLEMKGNNSNLSLKFQSAFQHSRKFVELYPWWKFPNFKKFSRHQKSSPDIYNDYENFPADFETEPENEIDAIYDRIPTESAPKAINKNNFDNSDLSKKSFKKSEDELKVPNFTEFYSAELDSSNPLNQGINYELNREELEVKESNKKKVKQNPRDFLS